MKVIVAGGGIAGLSLALSLRQAGIAARVYEAVDQPAPLGVGINLQPTAVRELTELGLDEDLQQTGIATERLSFFNKFGQLIWSERRGRQAGYKWPQYSIHRGELQMLLLRAARLRLGEANVRNGAKLVGFEQNAKRVVCMFRDSGGTSFSDEADVLVGADGINSTIRRHVYPAEGEPRFGGQVLWRGAVPAEAFLGGRTMSIAGHFHQRIVVYPIAPASNGQLLTNWICQITVEESATPREDWNREVSKERVLAAFDAWRFPWLELPALVEKTAKIYEFPLVDRDPVEAWTFGRVTLIGDAAHPMQPIGAQAGSQAIIDARALTAAFVACPGDPGAALRAYDAQRRPMMNEVVVRNRSFGPEGALQLVEQRAPNGFAVADDVISAAEIAAINATYSMAAALDIKSVNTRPSYVQASRARAK